ncbi:MAG: SRPBCC family protein [Dehalococcoidia bacterium]
MIRANLRGHISCQSQEIPVRFTTSIEIAAPPSTVWDVVADVTRWPEWTPSTIKHVEVIEGDVLAVGMRARITQPAIPKAVWTVSSVQPGTSFVWATRNMGMTMVADHVVEAAGVGTRVTLTLDATGAGSMILRPLLALSLPRTLRTEAHGLKRHAEGLARAS